MTIEMSTRPSSSILKSIAGVDTLQTNKCQCELRRSIQLSTSSYKSPNLPLFMYMSRLLLPASSSSNLLYAMMGLYIHCRPKGSMSTITTAAPVEINFSILKPISAATERIPYNSLYTKLPIQRRFTQIHWLTLDIFMKVKVKNFSCYSWYCIIQFFFF